MKRRHGALDSFIHECLQSGKYRVDADGSIWNLSFRDTGTARPLAQHANSVGYLRVGLVAPDGKYALVFVHRVSAIWLFGLPTNQAFEVDHIDGRKENNRFENLEWVDRSTNARRAFALGLRVPNDAMGRVGSLHQQAKLTEAQVLEIHELARRGFLQREIGERFGVSQPHISEILRGQKWSHIDSEAEK